MKCMKKVILAITAAVLATPATGMAATVTLKDVNVTDSLVTLSSDNVNDQDFIQTEENNSIQNGYCYNSIENGYCNNIGNSCTNQNSNKGKGYQRGKNQKNRNGKGRNANCIKANGNKCLRFSDN